MKKIVLGLIIICCLGFSYKIYFLKTNLSHSSVSKEQYSDKHPLSLLIENDTLIMKDFLGVNAVYHGFAFMPEQSSLAMNNLDREREFRRVKSINLKIARTWYRPDWACETSVYDDFNWNSEKMKAFYLWLDKMKALNVNVAIQAGWSFPKDTYMGHMVADSTRDIERYSTWVVESLNQMIKVRHYNNIKYLMLFTEPLNYHSKDVYYPYYTPYYYAKVCNAINEKLIKAQLRTNLKLVGPNSGSTDTAAYVGWSVNKLNKVIDIYSWHAYNGKTVTTNPPLEYDGWKQIVEAGKQKVASTGKTFWIDEYGANKPDETVRFKPDYGNYLAQAIAAFTNSGVQTSLLWILFDQKYGFTVTNNDSFYNGVHRWGLVRYPRDNVKNANKPYPAFYAFGLMSKYLSGKTPTSVYKTINADSVYVVATTWGKETSVMVVNAAHSIRKFQVKFSKVVNLSLDRYLYDPQKIVVSENTDQIVSDKSLKTITGLFNDELPSRAVAVYTTVK